MPGKVRDYIGEQGAAEERDYGDVMRFLLFFRERYSSDDEFGEFLVSSLQKLVYDLREFEVYISISPDSLRRGRRQTREGRT
ncbi:MAG TPA: hypothetical protein VFV34_11650 [Blastocatellia bacterium]|nr:hypothetical protein [Blastocatellia bacterium]